MTLFKRSSLINFIVFVISIMLLVLLIWYPYKKKDQFARELQQTGYELNIIHQAIMNFRSDTGNYPNSENGLISLYSNPGLKNWRGPYIESRKLIDPWGQPYKYENHFNDELPSFIASLGANRILDSNLSDIKERKTVKDDIILWLE